MWPWGHLAAGYLLYRLLTWGRAPAAIPALAVALGTQLPDLLDKPFAWTIPLLPNGRSLGHSLLLVPTVLVLALILTDGRERRALAALTLGYVTHLATDALYPALGGEWYYVGFLGWPLVPPIEYEGAPGGIIEHFLHFELTAQSGFELLLFAAGATLWLLDGQPGLRLLWRTAKDGVARVRTFVRV